MGPLAVGGGWAGRVSAAAVSRVGPAYHTSCLMLRVRSRGWESRAPGKAGEDLSGGAGPPPPPTAAPDTAVPRGQLVCGGSSVPRVFNTAPDDGFFTRQMLARRCLEGPFPLRARSRKDSSMSTSLAILRQSPFLVARTLCSAVGPDQVRQGAVFSVSRAALARYADSGLLYSAPITFHIGILHHAAHPDARVWTALI